MLWNAKNGKVRAGGSEMCCVSFGAGEKTLIVFPGLSDGLATVKGKALLLAPPYRRYFSRYTVYMFSRKDEMPSGYTVRDMARDQAEALDALGIGKTSVLGVSEGGMIAQYLAIDRPDLVQKLVLAVTAPRTDAAIAETVGRWIGMAKTGSHRELMIDTAERSYSPAYLRKYRKLYPILGHIGKPRDYGRFLANAEAILSFDASAEVGKIACPTLILGGAEDRIVGADASYALKESIPGSELYVYPGLGHAAYEEAGDFYERVFRFLEEGERGAGPG